MPQQKPDKPSREWSRSEVVNPNLQFRLILPSRYFNCEVVNREKENETANSVLVRIRKSIGIMDLTALTVEELDHLEQFWKDATALARPVVQSLDDKAKAAHDAGDLTNKRLWRPDPQRQDFRSDPVPLEKKETPPDDPA